MQLGMRECKRDFNRINANYLFHHTSSAGEDSPLELGQGILAASQDCIIIVFDKALSNSLPVIFNAVRTGR